MGGSIFVVRNLTSGVRKGTGQAYGLRFAMFFNGLWARKISLAYSKTRSISWEMRVGYADCQSDAALYVSELRWLQKARFSRAKARMIGHIFGNSLK